VVKKKRSRISYEAAPDLKGRMIEMVKLLGMTHIDLDRVECMRSEGSSTTRTIARCHALNKVMQKAMGTKAFYTIEFLEPFEKMNTTEQNKVIIHELMHIPKSFGGGFRHHDYVCDKNVEILHGMYESMKSMKV
jgi:predicted metallopeptidase